MHTAELIDRVAKDTGLTKVAAQEALRAIVHTISSEVKKGKKVQLKGFGSFERVQRKARSGRNPQTGEQIKIPACKYPKFKPGRSFKEAVVGR